MVVSCAKVRVTTKAGIVPTHNQDRLAMGLKPNHPIGNMNTLFLKPVGPADISLFIKARL